MVIATALFLILLAAAHVGDPDSVDRPLSLFRDEHPVVGHSLFGLLALVGALHLRTSYLLGRGRELLAVVALTPSPDIGHTLAAFVLLGFVFGWNALRLYRVSSPWLVLHLAVPLLLIVHVASSYGVWQNSIIVYFLLVANIGCLLATGRRSLPGPDAFERKPRRRARGKYAPCMIWRRDDRPPQ